jgi:hypothetical protein
MTQDPYGPSTGDVATEPPAQRVSLLAVFSLICSLICCIPGLGMLGTGLGIGGLFSVSRAQGRLTGGGMAIAGIVLGLLSSMAWIGGFIGVAWVSQQNNHNIQEPVLAAAAGAEQGDWTKLRALLTPQAQAQFTDERATAFGAEYHAKLGTYQGADPAPDMNRLIQQMQGGAGQGRRVTTGPGGVEVPLWVPLKFDKGTAYLIVIPDAPDLLREALLNNRSIQGRLKNIALETPAGDKIWLVPTSP